MQEFKESLINNFKAKHKLINFSSGKNSWIKIDKCMFCDSITTCDQIQSKFLSANEYLPSVFIYCPNCEKNAELSVTLDLIQNLALPSDWFRGTDFRHVRFSMSRYAGSVIALKKIDDMYKPIPFYELDDQDKLLIRDKISQGEWTLDYPDVLKDRFLKAL